jgi:hypothetical protein
MIDLEEGVRMMGNVIGVRSTTCRSGPVEVDFVRETDEIWLPMWRPVRRDSSDVKVLDFTRMHSGRSPR